MNCIEGKNVTLNNRNVRVLDNVNLRFEKNKIYGLIGRNGEGKTTLLNIITSRIFADSREVLKDSDIASENDHVLRKMYLVGEMSQYPESMKVLEVFKWIKWFYPDFDMDYATRIAADFELDTNKRIKNLSTGYNSIFKLVLALSANTPHILFNEPALSLDHNNHDLFHQLLIEKFRKNPCAIIISTHLIDEVYTLIENIVIIKNGTIIKNKYCNELLSKGYIVTGPKRIIEEYIVEKTIIGADIQGDLKTAYILGEIIEKIPEGIEVTMLDLQRLFIQLTKS